MNAVSRQIHSWGPIGFGLGALILAALALLIVYTRPTGVIPATTTEKVVPATGAEGFPVEVFCKDDDTQVRERIRPDGVVYELMRVKAQVAELVVWVPGPSGDNLGAVHYWYDEQKVQMSEPAVVTAGARRCIEDRAK